MLKSYIVMLEYVLGIFLLNAKVIYILAWTAMDPVKSYLIYESVRFVNPLPLVMIQPISWSSYINLLFRFLLSLCFLEAVKGH